MLPPARAGFAFTRTQAKKKTAATLKSLMNLFLRDRLAFQLCGDAESRITLHLPHYFTDKRRPGESTLPAWSAMWMLKDPRKAARSDGIE